ncbi:HTH-type transcriptional activator AllS [Janthinobacterium sp. HH103]|uniref:LysR family transcriptional regulator n=1 Tax=unclassified Janthinobacterium TaxID=2610881 RepID=UPI000874CC5A|nr:MULTISPECIES: LysR substrate-binding domain-containing protein [unclassified Janthinobacterium]OEZ65983.1 HTH-type transcriptional activator AllS [Janthinobacterium sp. HH100]OEZ68373.1 HTH-type transcriptional activator AllS [Janthinobacterium sp. HH103]PHV37171.1 LysR family transcriptional regulator [Janthinobacterium sp. BJB304]QOU73399.1 HTH-type transcriptional activator AllS [Janthinobacterium sp. HH102]
MDFDTALLRALLAVADTGGFTRAAERLHLSQSAVSHQIRRLEQQAGTALLQRTTRSLRLTEDGEDFLRHARQILAAQDALSRRFQRSSIAGAVRFGVPENFMGARLPALLAQFAHLFPAVRLDVTVGTYLDLQQLVAADALDLAVVMAPADSGDETAVLRRTRFVWAAAHDFHHHDGALPLPLAFSPAPCLHRQVGVDALDGAGLDWRVAFTSPSQQGLRAAVLAGLAVTALPQGDLEAGMVVIDGQHGLPALPAAQFQLVWRAAGSTAAAEAFGQLLREWSAAAAT